MKQIILILLVLLPVCAFAQFNETFDGPVLSPEWLGSRDSFLIVNGQLQLNAPKGNNGVAHLKRLISYNSDMQWEFDVQMKTVPSENNCMRIYLYMEDVDTYYYVQIGYKKDKNDKVEKKIGLRRNGGIDMFDRKENSLDNKTHLNIKVTLKDNKYWKMYSRHIGDNYYKEEGSCIYPISNHTNSGYFIINMIYTGGRNKHFLMDNIKISHEITPTDTIPNDTPVDPAPEEPSNPEVVLPQLLGVQPLSLSELQFVFDQAVDITDASFAVSDIGKANRITYADEKTKTTVNTRYPAEMVPEVNYTVSYTGITDMKGNKLASFSEDFVLEGEDDGETTPGSILINEIMADPKGLTKLPETEYVELYNTTESDLSLSGWQFSYGGKAKPMTTFEIPAKGYAVLYRSGREIFVDPSAIKVPLENFPASLANSGKLLQLFDGNNELIDEVTYKKATPAKSWERTSTGAWCLSTDPRGGTPGSVNSSDSEDSEKPVDPEDPITPDDPDEPDTPDTPIEPVILVEPGEFIFNELLPNPFAGGSEYIELYNRSDRALPLSGLSVAVRKNDGTFSTRYPLSSVTATIEPEGYVLLTKNLLGVTDFYTIRESSSLFEVPKLPILANTSSTLVLFRTKDETVIDEVSYSSKWHASSIKDQKGVALERIDPEKDTQLPSNWTSASASSGYGTPGYQNSQSRQLPPDDTEHPTGMDVPQWDNETNLYTIRYYLDQPGYNCRAFVFNTAGQRVAEIANHELLGLTGQLTWDGSSLAGKHLRTGVYIFYAEVYHINGQVKTYKKVFLVK